MAQKCILCEEKIKQTFLDKLDGTIIKIKKGDKNQNAHVCSDCQKQHKDNLKEVISGKV